ncbi:hypothetical protein H5410_021620, partial [Solanum commersonii]
MVNGGNFCNCFMYQSRYNHASSYKQFLYNFLNNIFGYQIYVPLNRYLREETNIDEDDESKKMLLQSSIVNIMHNTHLLICYQLDKIQRKEVVDETWRNTVLQPCLDIVKIFLKTKLNTFINNSKFNNKKVITHTEKQGVWQYLLGEIELDSDFTAGYFCLQDIVYIENFVKTQRVQLLLEGQIRILKNLWKTLYSCSNKKQSILNRRVDIRVYKMVNGGSVCNCFMHQS